MGLTTIPIAVVLLVCVGPWAFGASVACGASTTGNGEGAAALLTAEYEQLVGQLKPIDVVSGPQVQQARQVEPGHALQLSGVINGLFVMGEKRTILLELVDDTTIEIEGVGSIPEARTGARVRCLVQPADFSGRSRLNLVAITGDSTPLAVLQRAALAELKFPPKNPAEIARSEEELRLIASTSADPGTGAVSAVGSDGRPISESFLASGLPLLEEGELAPLLPRPKRPSVSAPAGRASPAGRQRAAATPTRGGDASLICKRAIAYLNPRLMPGEVDTITESIITYSARYNVDPYLVVAVIAAESRFNPRARSYKGAMGLGQLMPATAAAHNVNAYDAVANLNVAIRIIRRNLDRYGENEWNKALAAYNAGCGAVDRYGGVPPYRETRNYLWKIYEYWCWLNGITPEPRPQ